METLLHPLMEFFKPTHGASVVYLLSNIYNDELELHPLIERLLVTTDSYLCITLHSVLPPAEASSLNPFKLCKLI